MLLKTFGKISPIWMEIFAASGVMIKNIITNENYKITLEVKMIRIIIIEVCFFSVILLFGQIKLIMRLDRLSLKYFEKQILIPNFFGNYLLNFLNEIFMSFVILSFSNKIK